MADAEIDPNEVLDLGVQTARFLDEKVLVVV
jgi:hypothetical protein